MGFRQKLLLGLHTLLILGLGISPAHAQFQAEPQPDEQAQNPAPMYYTIMGEVARPGVYEIPQPTIRMTDLIKLTGGLTTQSNRNILYFRRGRPGQSAFFMPDSTVELQAGDIIIADSQSRAGHGRTPARPTSYIDRTAINRNGPPKEPLIYVALLGLADRPVVVPLRKESANFPMIFSLLRQDQNPMRAATVLVPRQNALRFTAEDQEPIQLATGSIVVFDEGTISRENLPPLPDVIHPEDAAAAAAPQRVNAPLPGRSPKIIKGMAFPGGPQNTVPPTATPAARTPETSTPAVESHITPPALPAVPTMTPPANSTPQEEAIPTQKSDEPSAGVDSSGIPGPQFGFTPPRATVKTQIRTVSNTKPSTNGPDLARVVAPSTLPAQAEQPQIPPREEPTAKTEKSAAADDTLDEETTAPATPKSASTIPLNAGTGMLMLMGGLCTLCCGGMVWMFRDLKRLQTNVAVPTQQQPATNSQVQQILYDELPLVEENLATRHEWNYQGRPQFMQERRLDNAHNPAPGQRFVPQPHANFVPLEQPAYQQPVYEQPIYEEEIPYESLPSATTNSGRTHRIDPQSPPGARGEAETHSRNRRPVNAPPQKDLSPKDLSSSGILERVLASVQGGKHARRS